MAKQLGIIQFSGKLGQTVGMRKSTLQKRNSMRVLVTPGNPRTEAQARQRMKLNAALKIYRAAEPILSRAFENKKYGTQSRHFFMSQLMSGTMEDKGYWLPYETKGDFRAIPGTVPFAIGSLSIDTTISGVVGTNAHCALLDIETQNACNTKGDMFREIVEAGKGIKNGDQITAVLVKDLGSDGGQSGVSFVYDSFLVDVNDTTPITTVASGSPIDIRGDRGLIDFSSTLALASLDQICAAAIIVSRDRNAKSGKAGLRTTSLMKCSVDLQQAWLSASALDAALASYMSAESTTSSDWPYDAGADTEGTTPTVDETVKQANITAGGQTYNNVAYVTIGGVKYVPYKYVTDSGQDILQGFKKAGDMAFTSTGGTNLGMSAAEDDQISAFAAAGYTLQKQSVFNTQHPGYTFS